MEEDEWGNIIKEQFLFTYLLNYKDIHKFMIHATMHQHHVWGTMLKTCMSKGNESTQNKNNKHERPISENGKC